MITEIKPCIQPLARFQTQFFCSCLYFSY